MSTGGDLDDDGYTFVVDSKLRQPVVRNATAQLATGRHSVVLEGVAQNCMVSGGQPRSVIVSAGRTVELEFEVVCAATGIDVTTRSRGVAIPDAYTVVLNGRPWASVRANGSTVVGRLEPGTFSAALIMPERCTLDEGNAVTVEVSARTVTPVQFDVTCATPSEKIAFVIDTTIDRIAQPWIGLVNPDGTGAVQLGPGYSPAWSPDGTKLVFSTTACDFYGVECTGGLVAIDPETRSGNTAFSGEFGWSPAWAPSGDAIAFLRCCQPGVPIGLYVAALDGSPARLLNTGDAKYVASPTWSPDSRQIAFSCVIGVTSNVCVVNRDGTGFNRLTDDALGESDATWGPDGRRMAVTITRGGPRVAVLTLGDRVVTPLTPGFEPAWSPDGTTLVFAGGDGLYTIAADGSNRVRLTTGAHHSPAWRR